MNNYNSKFSLAIVTVALLASCVTAIVNEVSADQSKSLSDAGVTDETGDAKQDYIGSNAEYHGDEIEDDDSDEDSDDDWMDYVPVDPDIRKYYVKRPSDKFNVGWANDARYKGGDDSQWIG